MSDADDRLEAVSKAIAEREYLVKVRTELAQDIATEEQRVQQLAKQLQIERADVERLTNGVMSFVNYVLAGEGGLAKEQRDVAEAQARLREAQGGLEGLRQQEANVRARLSQLDPAKLEAELVAARSAKADAVMRRGGPAAAQLQDIAIRIESIDIELVPLGDAVLAGGAAFDALRALLAAIDAAPKPPKQAQALAGDAQAKLVVFSRALDQIATASFDDRPSLDRRDVTFVDDWMRLISKQGVASARAEMVARIERIGAVLAPLRSRRDDLANRRKALVTERQTLVAGG
jgi:hypothetical protein